MSTSIESGRTGCVLVISDDFLFSNFVVVTTFFCLLGDSLSMTGDSVTPRFDGGRLGFLRGETEAIGARPLPEVAEVGDLLAGFRSFMDLVRGGGFFRFSIAGETSMDLVRGGSAFRFSTFGVLAGLRSFMDLVRPGNSFRFSVVLPDDRRLAITLVDWGLGGTMISILESSLSSLSLISITTLRALFRCHFMVSILEGCGALEGRELNFLG